MPYYNYISYFLSLAFLAHPTNKNLQLIKWRNEKGEDKELRIKKSICDKWKQVGDLLEIENSVLMIWDTNCGRQDPLARIDLVLNYWMENPIDEYPVSWKGLCKLLENIECSEVAKKLREALENSYITEV